MNTEDNNLKELFSRYQPEMTSGDEFLRRLAPKLDAVECLRRQAATVARRRRQAAWRAALAGMVCGLICGLLLPYLSHYLSAWLLTLNTPWLSAEALDASLPALLWIAAAAIVLSVTLSTYRSYSPSTAKI